jgi:hypothetical protein
MKKRKKEKRSNGRGMKGVFISLRGALEVSELPKMGR